MKNKRHENNIYDYNNFHDDNLDDLITVNLKLGAFHIFHNIIWGINDGTYHFSL
jgi:hypothetical protein